MYEFTQLISPKSLYIFNRFKTGKIMQHINLLENYIKY